MKFAAAAASWALLRVRSAESAGQQPGQLWGPEPLDGKPPGASSNVPHPAPAAPWWQSHPFLEQPAAIPPVQQPPAFPPIQQVLSIPSGHQREGVPLSLQHRRFGLQQQPELVQERSRLPIGGAAVGNDQHPSSAAIPSSAATDLWRVSNTGRAVQELLTQVNSAFQRSDSGWATGGLEEVVPVENVKKTLIELSKLIPGLISFCEAELTGQRSHGELARAGHPMSNNYGTASNFPVDAFIKQGSEYARRVTDQMRAARDLLSAVVAPSSNRANILREIQRFNAVMADGKEVYHVGSQISSAAGGAILPYLSTCSLFSKGDSYGAYRYWSLTAARINSTLRYLYQALEAVRKVSGRLRDLVSGKIQPQSLQDFARSKPFFRAAAYLGAAEERSVTAVTYVSKLAAAYNSHTRSLEVGPVGQPHEESGAHSSNQRGDDQQTVDAEDLNAEMSLMAEELVPQDAIFGKDGTKSSPDYFGESASAQTAIEEPAAVPWAVARAPGGHEIAADDEDMMQTIGYD